MTVDIQVATEFIHGAAGVKNIEGPWVDPSFPASWDVSPDTFLARNLRR
jgi:hypothetical protein